MSSPPTRRRALPPATPQPRVQRAYALIEALGALSIVLAGLLPMALVGTTGLGWLRQLERLAQATRSAADDAELGRCAAPLAAVAAIVPMPDADGCLPDGAAWGRP
ncbi:hypothetical protein [Cupriavidus neocaledonicus]|uniref:Uncharacterized protein n=1 Tax=Cupriavidus neocaledonicus TaxID=1040979 RepID=A0A375H9W5_9BURK|nr:hypothetical protein [Cupriavidus neocaledonicus]SOZ35719.1 conserved hypothetical protein; putative membrane protein [Cupriavidus neocaledonicus]SPD47686.1 conserved protein of unknown function [Cupriavidus neocaledonicus]